MGPTSYINPVTITPAIFRMDVSDSLLFFLFWWLFFFHYPVRGSVIWAPDDGLGSFYLCIRLTRSAYTSLFELALSSVISASNKCIKKKFYTQFKTSHNWQPCDCQPTQTWQHTWQHRRSFEMCASAHQGEAFSSLRHTHFFPARRDRSRYSLL